MIYVIGIIALIIGIAVDQYTKYLAITHLVHKALAQGLYVLAIDMPSKM